MHDVIPEEQVRRPALPALECPPRPAIAARRLEVPGPQPISPNALVRWAFYLSVFSIPFARLYVPGTGERVGVIRIVQLMLLGAVASQPRVCVRLVPVALLWFVGYCGVRILSGLWFSPELWTTWWRSTLDWLQFSLPWVWIAFNVLQFPKVRRGGLWAMVWGCALCASLHVLGIGVTAVDNSVEEVRTTVFGENANLAGVTYAAGLIVVIGLGMFNDIKLGRRLLLLPLIALLGLAMAKTGSRTALVMVGIGTLVLLFQADSFSPRATRYWTLLLIGAVLAVTVWRVPTIMERFNDLDAHDMAKDNPRARMAPVLWEMFLRSPIYGSGPDQYEYELTRRAMPYLIKEQRTIAAHNLVLLLLVETGIIGFLIFAVGFCRALTAAWRARLKPCAYMPLALFLPFFISGIVLSNPTSNQSFWFALAYALAGAA